MTSSAPVLAPRREGGHERQSNRAGKRVVEEREKGKRKGGGRESRAYPNMP